MGVNKGDGYERNNGLGLLPVKLQQAGSADHVLSIYKLI